MIDESGTGFAHVRIRAVDDDEALENVCAYGFCDKDSVWHVCTIGGDGQLWLGIDGEYCRASGFVCDRHLRYFVTTEADHMVEFCDQ